MRGNISIALPIITVHRHTHARTLKRGQTQKKLLLVQPARRGGGANDEKQQRENHRRKKKQGKWEKKPARKFFQLARVCNCVPIYLL